VQYFRELQSLLQQFIIVEHAVDPAVDAASSEQQQAEDQAGLATMKQESQAALAADETTAAEAEGDAGGAAEAEADPPVDMGMVDMSSAMDTSEDNQMAFEQDQQSSAEPFVAEETGPSDIAWYISLVNPIFWSAFRENIVLLTAGRLTALCSVARRLRPLVDTLLSLAVLPFGLDVHTKVGVPTQQRIHVQPCHSDFFVAAWLNTVWPAVRCFVKSLIERKQISAVGYYINSTDIN